MTNLRAVHSLEKHLFVYVICIPFCILQANIMKVVHSHKNLEIIYFSASLLDSFPAGTSYHFIDIFILCSVWNVFSGIYYIYGTDTDNYETLKLLYSDYQNSSP